MSHFVNRSHRLIFTSKMGHFGNRSHREIVTWKICHLGKSSLQKGRHFPIHFCSDSFSSGRSRTQPPAKVTHFRTVRFWSDWFLKVKISRGGPIILSYRDSKFSWKRSECRRKLKNIKNFLAEIWNSHVLKHDLNLTFEKNAGLISYRMMTSSHATSWWFPGAFLFFKPQSG